MTEKKKLEIEAEINKLERDLIELEKRYLVLIRLLNASVDAEELLAGVYRGPIC